jgi:hypothetical protein
MSIMVVRIRGKVKTRVPHERMCNVRGSAVYVARYVRIRKVAITNTEARLNLGMRTRHAIRLSKRRVVTPHYATHTHIRICLRL